MLYAIRRELLLSVPLSCRVTAWGATSRGCPLWAGVPLRLRRDGKREDVSSVWGMLCLAAQGLTFSQALASFWGLFVKVSGDLCFSVHFF